MSLCSSWASRSACRATYGRAEVKAQHVLLHKPTVLDEEFASLAMQNDCAGEKSRRIRELTSIVQKRFGFADGAVELYAEKVMNRGLCAVAQAESLRYKLLGGLAVRRCAHRAEQCSMPAVLKDDL